MTGWAAARREASEGEAYLCVHDDSLEAVAAILAPGCAHVKLSKRRAVCRDWGAEQPWQIQTMAE